MERNNSAEQLLHMYSVDSVFILEQQNTLQHSEVMKYNVSRVHMTDFIYVFLKHISVSVQPKEKQTALIPARLTQPRVKGSIGGENTLIYIFMLSNPICASVVHAL